ncbi:MAG TPA: helix-turn-helix transcriptional regulator [Anaeromyxobacter sp.]|nr:helix-turn-helix transcriptional regulator [Anaeromyxobacter sp.]
MPEASAARSEEVLDLVSRLGPGARVVEEICEPLRQALGASRAGAIGYVVKDGRVAVDFFQGVGTDPGQGEHLDALVAELPAGFSGYDPLNPVPSDRNRARLFPGTYYVEEAARSPAEARYLGLHPWLGRENQVRALVCEGPILLSWFGVAREEPFGERERRALQKLVPALRDRLLLERQLDAGALGQAGLAAAMEAIGAPAFLLGPGGIAHANGPGRELLSPAGHELADELRAAVGSPVPGPWAVHRVTAPGLPLHHLLVRRRAPPRLGERAEAFAARHRLSPRQREVLAELVTGTSNKTIAARLRCAESTVELHVTSLLARTGAASRAGLVARFWSEDLA